MRETVVVQQQSQALPALVNVFLPGVGQLIQGRIMAALCWWVILALSAASLFVFVGVVLLPLMWILNIVDAAKYRPPVQKVRV